MRLAAEPLIQCPATEDAWNRAVQDARGEGQGIWVFVVISAANASYLCQRAAAGDLSAERAIHAVPALLDCLNAHTAPSPAAPACLACGDSFWREHCPGAVIVLCAAATSRRTS